MYQSQKHWGPYLWGFIHNVSIIDGGNIVDQTRHIISILTALKNVIPCPICVSKYESHLKKLQYVDLREPMVLFYWSVDLHNEVNTKLGKGLLSYSKALQIWTKN